MCGKRSVRVFGLWLLRPDHEELFSLFQPCFRLVSDILEMLQIRFLLKQVLSVSVFPEKNQVNAARFILKRARQKES